MFLRRIILVIVLLAAQMAAGVHALEHLTGQEEGHPLGQTCTLCLAAHDLSAALAAHITPLPAPIVSHVLTPFFAAGRIAFPAPLARQRGPPVA